MSTVQSARQAIDDFVDVIAQYYFEVKDQPSAETQDSSVEEFVSEIEKGLRSTLMDRIAELETRHQVESTPTQELSVDFFSADRIKIAPEPANLERTLDSSGRDFSPSASADPLSPIGLTKGSSASQIHAALGETVNDGESPQGSDLSFDQQADTSRKRVVRNPHLDETNLPAPEGYEILGILGRGGMGVVYKALHLALNRTVAIKMVISGEHASKDQLARFQREAEAAAHLSHPNIVSVYEVGEYKGLPYFSLEYVDGASLFDLMKDKTFAGKQAAEMLLPVSRAVDYSHSMGVLHRDLKPQNVLVTRDGIPKVADFGLAKRLDSEDDQTRTGVIVGTPGYMAPEQARDSQSVCPATDVYALGCILYFMMTGRPPFRAPTPFETMRQLLVEEPVAPSQLQMELDRDLETICLKALEKEINRRYATAGEFAEELQRYLAGEPILARPITRRERMWKWCKRNPRVAVLTALAASLLACLLLGGIIFSIVVREERNRERIARKVADQNASLAEDQAELALDTTRMVLYETKKFFEGKPELRPLRENMITGIVQAVEEIHTSRYANDVRGIFHGSAAAQLGQIYLDAGLFQKARDKLLAAEQQLHRLDKEGKLFRADISQMNITLALGQAYSELGELREAEAKYQELLILRNDYFQRNPDISELAKQQSLAEAYAHLGGIYRALGQPKKSLEFLNQAVQWRRLALEQRPENLQAMQELAGTLTAISALYEAAGNSESMLDAIGQALELQSKIAERKSDVPSLHNMAKDQKVYARQNLKLGRAEQAEVLLQQSIATFEELLKQGDGNQVIQSQAVDAYYLLGIAQHSVGKDAAESYARAEQLQRMLISKSDNVNTQGMLLKILARAGNVSEAVVLADKLAETRTSLMHCGYAACGYALVSEQLASEDPRKQQLIDQAIEYSMLLIENGYQDFESMRSTDLDFAPLQDNPEFVRKLNEQEMLLGKTR